MKYLLVGVNTNESTIEDNTNKEEECDNLLVEGYKVLDFIKVFASFPLIEEIAIKGKDTYNYSELYKSYANNVKNFIVQISESKYPFLKEKKVEVFFHVMLYIQQTLYSLLLSSVSSEEDKEFFERCKSMQELNPKHFQVKSDYINEHAVKIGVSEILRADTAPSVQEKFQCYMEMHRTVGTSISMWSSTPAGANEIIPLIIYLIVQAAPKRLVSILK